MCTYELQRESMVYVSLFLHVPPSLSQHLSSTHLVFDIDGVGVLVLHHLATPSRLRLHNKIISNAVRQESRVGFAPICAETATRSGQKSDVVF